jgi:hypothetical protein
MHLKKMFAALIACLALGAVAANSAQAEGTCWTIEGTCLSGSETVHIEKHAGSSLSLTATVIGQPLTLNATGVHCAIGATCTIDNTVSPNHSEGALEFTGVTVVEPANCTVSSPVNPAGTVTTNPLTDTVIMDRLGGTAVFDKFFTDNDQPLVVLVFGGPKCEFDELEVPVFGTVTGRAVHASGDIPTKTNEQFVVQSLLFNKAEQETGGGHLYVGEGSANEAFFDGTVDNALSGPETGKIWGSD